MNRKLPVLAVGASILLVAGCDSGPEPAPPRRADAAHKPAPSAKGFELPAHARLLVPETSDSSDLALARFTPRQGTYTVYARCTGKGNVSIVDADRPEEEPIRVTCNGVDTAGLVHSELEAQSLRMRVHGGAATWTVAVVDGAQDV